MKTSRILIYMTAASAVMGCSKHDRTITSEILPSMQVSTAKVIAEKSLRTTHVTGTVMPAMRAEISSKVVGNVSAVNVALGQSVKQGDVLVEISAEEIKARHAQARANLNKVSRDLERETALLEKGASTQDMVNTLEDQKRAAKAAVDEASTMLGYVRIKAPFDGVVAEKHVDVGDFAGVGSPLLALDGEAGLRAVAAIPESLAALPIGTSLSVIWDGGQVEGQLAELSSAADSKTRSVTAKVDLPASATLRSGKFVRIAVPTSETTNLMVPETAVSRFGQMEHVFVVSDGRAVLRLVRTGTISANGIEILAGLRAGETIVVPIPTELRDGQPVEVAE